MMVIGQGAPMIESIHFKNFKVLRQTAIPLSRITLIVGPNGTGKSTILQAMRLYSGWNPNGKTTLSVDTQGDDKAYWEVQVRVAQNGGGFLAIAKGLKGKDRPVLQDSPFGTSDQTERTALRAMLGQYQLYSLDAKGIMAACRPSPTATLQENGTGLAAVLDRLRDQSPEHFEALSRELSQCLPEFDRILFGTTAQGEKFVQLRTRRGGYAIPATELSQGTLIALALLTLAYLPDPPPIIGLEEPDRGIHPRLLRDIQAALYRLAYPEQYGENRGPVQVIATTHSPYFLNLFRDHPDHVVIADRKEDNVEFHRLSDHPDITGILSDVSLGEAWYTGILGGVPAKP